MVKLLEYYFFLVFERLSFFITWRLLCPVFKTEINVRGDPLR
jgi:hypothetical protein